MRYLILSDIHSNLDALDAVLAAAEPYAWDRVLLLGDLVGYGAEPNAVIDRLRSLHPFAAVRGNHDKVAGGHEDAEGFNPLARQGALWTAEALTPENKAYLSALAAGPVAVDDLLEICHGTPFDEDAYVFDELDALRAIRAASRPVCLYAHTHCAMVYRLTEQELDICQVAPFGDTVIVFDPSSQYLVNVGSVGQPRDGNPRAGFGVIDSGAGRLTLVRVDYPLERTQAKILEAGLPAALAHRLAVGR